MVITPPLYDGWYEVDIQGVRGAVQEVGQKLGSHKLLGSHLGLVAACGLRGRRQF